MRCKDAHKKGDVCDRRLLAIVLDGAGCSWEGVSPLPGNQPRGRDGA